jgi:hypothetical protein
MRSSAFPRGKRLAAVAASALVACITGLTAAAVASQPAPLSGSLAKAAGMDGLPNDFNHLLQSDGVSQAQLDAVEALLASVHFSIENKPVPNYTIAESALDRVSHQHRGQTVTVADLARAIAVDAFQVELYQAAVAHGLTLTDAQMSAIADHQEALYNESPDPNLLPQGQTADEFFHSAAYRTAYAQALEAERMKSVIIGSLTGAASTAALRNWAAQRFLTDVTLTGLGSVTPSNLADFL